MNPKMVTLEQLQSEGTILLGRIRDFMDSGVDTLELEISDKFDGAYVDGGYLILCKGSQKLQLGPFASGDSDLPEVTIADNGKVLKVVNGVWAKGIDATGGGESYDDTELRGRISAIENKESGWNAKYIKPNGGIPKTDLASDVQTSLGKADTALQSHQDISGKSDVVISLVSNITPTQVATAISQGKTVVITAYHDDFGSLSFEAWNVSTNLNLVISNTTARVLNRWATISLQGYLTNNTWEFASAFIARSEDLDDYALKTDLYDYAKTEDAVAISQGTAHANEFLVVGDDGNVTTQSLPLYDGSVV